MCLPYPQTILSPSAPTPMQKTLISLWGFATAHFHGKSSVLCLCQQCQVFIIHRDDSQSKARTKMSPCNEPLLMRGIVSLCWTKTLREIGLLNRLTGSILISNSDLVAHTSYRLWEMNVLFALLSHAKEMRIVLSHAESQREPIFTSFLIKAGFSLLKKPPASLSFPCFCLKVTRIHIQLAQNQWSLGFTVQKEAELIFTVIKQGGKPVPEACHLPPTHKNHQAYTDTLVLNLCKPTEATFDLRWWKWRNASL